MEGRASRLGVVVSVSAWEAIFMFGVLKIPVIYLAAVVWWAIRAEPEAPWVDDDAVGVHGPLQPCGWGDWKRRRPVRPGHRPIRPFGPRLPVRARAS